MTLSKNFWVDAVIFAVLFFFFGLGLDWMRGRELDFAGRGIATALTMPIYLIVKIWLLKRRRKASDA